MAMQRWPWPVPRPTEQAIRRYDRAALAAGMKLFADAIDPYAVCQLICAWDSRISRDRNSDGCYHDLVRHHFTGISAEVMAHFAYLSFGEFYDDVDAALPGAEQARRLCMELKSCLG